MTPKTWTVIVQNASGIEPGINNTSDHAYVIEKMIGNLEKRIKNAIVKHWLFTCAHIRELDVSDITQ